MKDFHRLLAGEMAGETDVQWLPFLRSKIRVRFQRARRFGYEMSSIRQSYGLRVLRGLNNLPPTYIDCDALLQMSLPSKP